jgi:hypothetical protein
MTKTFTTIISLAFTNPGLTLAMLLTTIAGESLFGDFGFGSFEFIWDLVFGAWNFRDFGQQVYFCKIILKLV